VTLATYEDKRAVQRKTDEAACRRVWELKEYHSDDLVWRRRIRDICNGGTVGMAALLGSLPANADTLPAANLILSGITRLSQRLGQAPDVRVDLPATAAGDKARKAAELRERIISSYDGPDGAVMELQLPQVARWLVGYGFAVWVVREMFDPDGNRFPLAELRDPIDAYPGQWGPRQHPEDIMFLRRVPRDKLAKIYPRSAGKIFDGRSKHYDGTSLGLGTGRVITNGNLGQVSGNWERAGNNLDAAEVAEYHDAWGCYVLLYDGHVLDSYPHPLRRGSGFVVVKRFAMDKLQGQFDHIVGLLAAMARLNLLAEIATQDAVFAETVITGRMDHEYRKGRHATNFIEGGDVKKVTTNLPYQLFQEIDRLERQLRVTSGYSAQSDGESPMSFVTGRGLNELASGVDFEIREYQTALRYALQALDSKRLEWDDAAYPNSTRMIFGEHQGAAFAESYTPAKHIQGNYRTRRAYGAMAGFDDYQKIVAGLQLMSAKVISRETMQENLHGLENLARERQRIQAEQVEETLLGMLASGQPVDPRVPLTLAELLPEGQTRTMILKYWTPEEPQPSDAVMDMLNPQPEMQLPERPPDITTAMSLLRSTGRAEGGVQTVSRVA
jgi:hypothetical protein